MGDVSEPGAGDSGSATVTVGDSAAAHPHRGLDARSSTARHIPSLDGFRALAICAVLGGHAGAPGFDLGWLGVDMFFVLSGFLIATLLVREFDRTGSISLPRFWGRRFLRLMPAYWIYIGALSLMMAAGIGALQTHAGWSPTLYITSLWGYFVNYAPMGGIWTPQKWQMLTLALWSLAVEEQFYLLWPGVCLLLLKGRRRIPPAAIGWGLVLAFMICRHFVSDEQLPHQLFTRGIGIIIGCATALTFAAEPSPVATRWLNSPVARWGVVTVSLILVLAFAAPYVTGHVLTDIQKDAHHLLVQRYAVPPLDLLFANWIAMLWYGPRDALDRLLASRPLAYIGRISYGIYLYHMAVHLLVWGPLLGGIQHWSKWPKFGLRTLAFVGISIAVASISHAVIERPFLKLKRNLR